MNLIKEIKELSSLRKNAQLVQLFMLFTNALLMAVGFIAWTENYGVDGMITNNYIQNAYSLLLLIPIISVYARRDPMVTLKIAITMEVLSMVALLLMSLGIYPQVTVIIGSYVLLSSNLMMRPLNEAVNSAVTDKCTEYGAIKSKLDVLYTAAGSLVGILLVQMELPLYVSILLLTTVLLISRYFRVKVFDEVFK